jgi:membrane-bound serine protease (ClpP class)
MARVRTRVVTFACIAALACAVVAGRRARAEDGPEDRSPGPFEKILVVDFEGEIGALTAAYMKRRIEQAKSSGVDCLVVRFDSPGGIVFYSKEIGDALFGLPESVHVVAWIPKMALSGAAWVALACDEIIMAPGATLGDAQPILGGGTGKPEPVGEKLESPLRAWFTGYARENGYPELLAKAMVSAHLTVIRVQPREGGPSFFVQGDEFEDADPDARITPAYAKRDLVQVGQTVVREGELLTMTSREAHEYGFLKRPFEDDLPREEETVLAALKAPGAVVEYTEMSFSERASEWLLGFAGILAAIVAVAVALFIFQGPGLMTIIGGIALVLMVLINTTADQVHGFQIFLILLGMGLLAAEVFIIPGFGIAGILGIGAMAAGFLFMATGSTIGETGSIDGEALVSFGLQFVFTMIVGLVVMLTISRFVPKVGPARRMVLQAPDGATLARDDTGASGAPAVGARGRAASPLRPAGSAEFDGALVDVISDGGFIAAEADVEVVAVEGERVTVRALSDGGEAGA